MTLKQLKTNEPIDIWHPPPLSNIPSCFNTTQWKKAFTGKHWTYGAEPLTVFWYDDVFCDFPKLKRLRFSKVIFGVTTSPICRKNWKLLLCRHRSSPSEVFLRKGALKICSKLKEYTYAEVRFHFGIGVLPQICRIFSEHLFLRTPLKGYFCTWFLWRRHLPWNSYWIIQKSTS